MSSARDRNFGEWGNAANGDTGTTPFPKAAREEGREARKRGGAWKNALEEACSVRHLSFPGDPKEVLNNLLAFEVQTALNPAVSEEAEALIERGRAESAARVAELEGQLKLRGISYCPDLADEGTPWESVAEPEPQYFATFLEAYDFQFTLAERKNEELRKALRAFVAYDQTFPGVLSGNVPSQLGKLIEGAKSVLGEDR